MGSHQYRGAAMDKNAMGGAAAQGGGTVPYPGNMNQQMIQNQGVGGSLSYRPNNQNGIDDQNNNNII